MLNLAFPVETRGSRASKVLEQAWSDLRLLDSRIPPAVIVILDVDGRRKKRGHFAHSSWAAGPGKAHEVAISPGLFADPKGTLATLIHEAVHAILWPDHRGGVTGRYYHSKLFRNVCRELELGCEFHNTRYGWTQTGWHDDRVPSRYAKVLHHLELGLPEGTARQPSTRLKPGRLPTSGLARLHCQCSTPRTILVAARSRAGAITCGRCGKAFSNTVS